MTALEPADFPRDQWGRPKIVVDGGKEVPYARPSGYGNCIDNRFNIDRWIWRNILVGVGADHSLYARVCALDASLLDHRDHAIAKAAKKEWNRLVEDCQKAAKAHSRADIGTALHKMTERLDRGEALDLPPIFARDIDAYQQAMTDAGLTVVPGMIECRCVCDEIGAAGSFDRVLERQSRRRHIGDLKTGGSSDFPHGFAVQLGIYAHSVLYDPVTGERTPMPDNLDQDVGIIVHLPAGEGRCSIYEIDLVKGWEAAQRAKWVKDVWQKDKSLLTPLAAVTSTAAVNVGAPDMHAPSIDSGPSDEATKPGNPEVADALRARCAWIKEHSDAGYRALRGNWPTGVDLRITPNADQLNAIAALVDEIEREYDVPFGPQPDVKVERPATPPDEGREADPHAIVALRGKVRNLTKSAQQWLKEVTAQADETGYGVNLTDAPTLRRFELARGLVKLAANDMSDRLPELVALVVGDQPGDPVTLLASMSADEAAQFARHVDALVLGLADEEPRLMPVA